MGTTTSPSYGNIGTGNKQNTGVYAADNYSNIHDLLGNCYEWTAEYSNLSSSPNVNRGGGYSSSSYCAAYRRHDDYHTFGNISFYDISLRVQIYVK